MNKIKLAIITLGLIVITFGAIRYVPIWVDYHQFRDAGRAVLNGYSPYDLADGFYNAPWLAFVLIPFAVQDDATGNGLMFVLGFAAFGFVAYRAKMRGLALIAFMLSPGVISNQILPNIDWLPLVGLFVPRWLGLPLLIIKPQVGIGVALIWLIESYRAKQIIKTFTPLVVAFGLSVIIYGTWFLRASNLTSVGWNSSLFPYSLIIGIPLFYFALRRLRPDIAITSTVLCSPYVGSTSWSAAFVSLASYPRAMLIASSVMWLYRIVKASWQL